MGGQSEERRAIEYLEGEIGRLAEDQHEIRARLEAAQFSIELLLRAVSRLNPAARTLFVKALGAVAEQHRGKKHPALVDACAKLCRQLAASGDNGQPADLQAALN